MKLDILRELDPELDAAHALTEQDEQLLAMILAQPTPELPRRGRSYTRRLVILTAAVVAIVGLGLTRIDLGGSRIGSSAAAAAVLQRAADVTIRTADPVVGVGEYLHITRIELTWGFEGTESRSIRIGSDGKPVVYQQRTTDELWVPYDRDDDWFSRKRIEPVRNVSRDAIPLNRPVPAKTVVLPAAGSRENHNYSRFDDERWYRSLPPDPQKLASALMDLDPGRSTKFYIEEIFSQVLQSGVTPAYIRAALLRALVDIPGVTMVGDITNLDGTPGVAIGYRGSNWQMLFDPETGRFIGSRATWPQFPDVPGLDRDKTTWLSTVRTEVVDSAPTD